MDKGYENLEEKIIRQTEDAEQTESTENGQQDEAGELMEILLNTREQGQMMEQLIRHQIEVKDEMISKLHTELEYYRRGEADRFVDQLMKAVIKVRKDMKNITAAKHWDLMDADAVKQEYQYIFEDITDLLEQQNVDAYQTEEGAAFDAAIHQPKVEVTTDPALDKTVKQSLAEGYKKGDKVLIAERVIVYQYKA